MKPFDILDALSNFPEELIASVMHGNTAQKASEQNEIEKIFSSDSLDRRKQSVPQPAGKQIPEQLAGITSPMPGAKSNRRLARAAAIGLTAAAAFFSVGIGIIAYHAQKPESALSNREQQPAAATGTASEFVSMNETQSTAHEDEHGSSANEEAAQTAPSEFTGTNYLGGQGHLRPLGTEGYEDDTYWYLEDCRTRIPKAAPAEDGKYHNELICQTAGCSHQIPTCPLCTYYRHLISDGETIFYQNRNQIMYITDGGTDTCTPFFSLTTDSAGNSLSELYRSYINDIRFYNLTKLGDTGKWFVFAGFSKGEEYIRFCVIFTPNTDTPIVFDADDKHINPSYDASTETLWFSGMRTTDFIGFDIRTGEKKMLSLSDQYQVYYSVSSAFCAVNGKLYGNITSYVQTGADLTDYISIDTADGMLTVLEEKTNLKNFRFIDGKRYALRSRSVLPDTFTCSDPDGSNEEVLYEHNGRITNAYALCSGFFHIMQDSGSYLMIDGTLLQIVSDSF